MKHRFAAHSLAGWFLIAGFGCAPMLNAQTDAYENVWARDFKPDCGGEQIGTGEVLVVDLENENAESDEPIREAAGAYRLVTSQPLVVGMNPYYGRYYSSNRERSIQIATHLAAQQGCDLLVIRQTGERDLPRGQGDMMRMRYVLLQVGVREG